MSEQGQRQDLQNLQQMSQQYAQAQDTEFQMNEFAPFADKAQEKRDMFGAGLENLMGAGTSFALLGQLGGLGGILGNTAPGATPGATPGALPTGYTNVPGGVNIDGLLSNMLGAATQAQKTRIVLALKGLKLG